MKFNEEQKTAFLKDIPFYENNDCFCLGNSLEEAGKILKQIAEGKNCVKKKNERSSGSSVEKE